MALNFGFSYRDGDNQNASLSAVHLYQQKNSMGLDSLYQTNRYSVSPNKNLNYSLGITYTEPLLTWRTERQANAGEGMNPGASPQRGGGRGPFGRGNGPRGFGQQGLFLQLNYRYQYSHQKSDPLTYDFPDYTETAFAQVLNEYRDWATLFGFLDNPYESYLSRQLSRYSERTEYSHTAEVQLRYVRDKMNMNVGVALLPERSHFVQNYLNTLVDTVRTVTNISPTLNMHARSDATAQHHATT